MGQSKVLISSCIAQLIVMIILLFNINLASIILLIGLCIYFVYTLKLILKEKQEVKLDLEEGTVTRKMKMISSYSAGGTTSKGGASLMLAITSRRFLDIENDQEIVLIDQEPKRYLAVNRLYEVTYYAYSKTIVSAEMLSIFVD